MFFRQIFFFIAALAIFFGFSFSTLAQNEDRQSEAIAQFEQGQIAHEKGDLQTALKFYEKAIELHAEFPEAEYQRGVAFQQLNKLPEAEKSFRRAIELREDWSLPMAKLGAILVRQNKFAEAEPILNKAIELDAANAPALIALAELQINSKSAPEKLRSLLGKIRAQTDGKANAPVGLWSARAALELNLGDKTAAKSSVSRALQISPNNLSARLTRAELLLQENDFTAALDDAKFAFTASPEDLQTRLLLARVYFATGKADESVQILDALNAEQKSLPEVVSVRNLILANGANDKESIAALEKLLVTEPKSAVVLGKLCILTRTVNPAKSLEYCRHASELEPNNAAHVVNYAAALVQARQFDSAINLLRRILEIAPENYTARANLATALYESKRFPEAIKEFNRLLEAKPDNPVSYFFLATAHDALENYVEAMAAYQKFLALADPKINQLEIDKVKLRLPSLSRQIEKGAGKKKPRT